MVSVYRIEHRYKRYVKGVCVSPYHIDKVVSAELYSTKYEPTVERLFSAHSWGSNRGNPYHDGLNQFNSSYSCACPTFEALKEWFEGFYDDLLQLGFIVREYKVKEIHIGNSELQCIFKREHICSRKSISVVSVNTNDMKSVYALFL